MARDRQQAKRRQAERREARLRERGRAADAGGAGDGARAGRSPREPADGRATGADGTEGPEDRVLDPATEARLATAAPPEAAGRSDTVVEAPPAAPEIDGEAPPHDVAAERDRRAAAEERPGGRVVAFLVAVWAELKRVQWPDRKALTTLTGVVLGFVLIAGGYLGGLDAIFSRLIQTIL